LFAPPATFQLINRTLSSVVLADAVEQANTATTDRKKMEKTLMVCFFK